MRLLLTALALCASTQMNPSDAQRPLNPLNNQKDAISPDFSVIEISHAREYVEKIYPLAAKIEQERNIPTAVTIAIASLESGYGRSYYAQTKHNHLGIRAYYQGKAGYRTFSSDEACFEYFGAIFDLERYQPLQTLASEDLEVWVKTICECGYNHRPSYIKKVMQMIRFLKLDQLDYPLA